MIALAKKYGITTPYTSYLVVPDAVGPTPQVLGAATRVFGSVPVPTDSDLDMHKRYISSGSTTALPAPHYLAPAPQSAPARPALPASLENSPACGAILPAVTSQTGKEGVDLALALDDLRNGDKIAHAATKAAAGRTCVEVNGAWVDSGYEANMPALKVKAMSAAYFRILARHPEMKDVLRLGNRLVWVTPSGTALVIDADGKETLGDDEIDKLFVAKK